LAFFLALAFFFPFSFGPYWWRAEGFLTTRTPRLCTTRVALSTALPVALDA